MIASVPMLTIGSAPTLAVPSNTTSYDEGRTLAKDRHR
jgi:hypothetical protein